MYQRKDRYMAWGIDASFLKEKSNFFLRTKQSFHPEGTLDSMPGVSGFPIGPSRVYVAGLVRFAVYIAVLPHSPARSGNADSSQRSN